MKATELAQKVFEFIAHNQIDTSKVSMDEIVQAFFEAQLKAIDEAGNELFESLI